MNAYLWLLRVLAGAIAAVLLVQGILASADRTDLARAGTPGQFSQWVTRSSAPAAGAPAHWTVSPALIVVPSTAP